MQRVRVKITLSSGVPYTPANVGVPLKPSNSILKALIGQKYWLTRFIENQIIMNKERFHLVRLAATLFCANRRGNQLTRIR